MGNRQNTVAILNSRQGLRPVGSDLWINNTRQAVQQLTGKDVLLLTSVGMKTWELLVYLAHKYKIKQRIYAPIAIDQKNIDVITYYSKQFKLSQKLTEWYFFEVENVSKDNLLFQKERDKLICQSADIIYPISIRTGSTLKQLYNKSIESQTVVNDGFMSRYSKSKNKYKYKINSAKVNPEIDKLLKGYLIHWTRTANSCWPNEKLSDYYKSIVKTKNDYSHSAYMTLQRILSENILRASSRHYRKNLSAVSFSELKPSMAVSLMKWRARYREMSFEPYGIAVRKTTAQKIGIRKVIYGESKSFRDLGEIDKPYFQSIGTRGYWTPEKEWRFIGDIDLSKINQNDKRIIVLHKNEAIQINKKIGLPNEAILSLFS